MKIVNGVQIISLEVDPQTWNVIMAGLNELPRRHSEPVIQNLTRQVTVQTQPPPVVEPMKALVAAEAIPAVEAAPVEG